MIDQFTDFLNRKTGKQETGNNMKNQKYQIKNFVVWSFFAFLMVSLAMMTTGCGKKDGKTATTPVNPYNPACPSCIADGTQLGAALGFNGGTLANYRLELGLTFAGSAGASGFSGYSGPVSAIGIMSVRVSSQYCPMPVGAYQVATTANGQWDPSLGGFRGLSLEARHTDGTIVRLHFDYGIIRGVQPNLVDDGSRVYPYGLMADVIVDSVNSVACVVGYPGLPPLNKFFFTY
ncbi:MAG: hypothetical protein IPK68_02970 [Bdellovibrionales bacterium]|nr:hypothetical protein [Bdellovibrionales bacterium]